jgi:phosphoribosylamine-glycine ligase
VTAQGNTISEAVETAKNALGLIRFEGMNFRKDIGFEFKG